MLRGSGQSRIAAFLFRPIRLIRIEPVIPLLGLFQFFAPGPLLAFLKAVAHTSSLKQSPARSPSPGFPPLLNPDLQRLEKRDQIRAFLLSQSDREPDVVEIHHVAQIVG